MKKNSISKIYAKSLFAVANKLKIIDLVYHDMKKIEKVLDKLSSLDYFILNHPLININKKFNIICNSFNFSCKISKNIIFILLLKKKEYILYQISLEYQNLYYHHNGIINIIFITSYLIEEYLQKIIIKNILKKYLSLDIEDKKYHIKNIINKKLIGGICIYIKNIKFDFTIKHQLSIIKNINLS